MSSELIRHAAPEDMDRIYEIELMTFPPAEAADMEKFRFRLKEHPAFFFVTEVDGVVQAYITCIPVNTNHIDDRMYEPEPFPKGKTLAVLAVGTNPEFQRRGIGGRMIKKVLTEAKALSMDRAVLACKEDKFHFYSSLGFKEAGKSKSEHGGAVWYDMITEL